tara:strand:- start:60 stop:278 length:219 start_codon:yes stop_codon:yes gene_type:complete
MSLIQNFNCKSYSIVNGGIFIKKNTPATNWKMYLQNNLNMSVLGTGYKLDIYKACNGIKKTTIKKNLTKEAA